MTQPSKTEPSEFIEYNIDNASNSADKVIEWELERINDIRKGDPAMTEKNNTNSENPESDIDPKDIPDDFIPYKIENAENPADRVIQLELERINNIRKSEDRNSKEDATTQNCIGMAVSGGGIRSATFSLGVMQAIAKNDWLKHFDYLSTVSGGGYLGSSLSFFLKGVWNTQQEEKIQFAANQGQFPYGWEGKPKSELKDTARQTVPKGFLYKEGILRFLRQHGNYLFPGRGLTFLAFVAAYLRGFVMNFVVYFPWLTLILIILFLSTEAMKGPISNFIPSGLGSLSGMFQACILATFAFIVSCIFFAIGTGCIKKTNTAYQVRTNFSKKVRYLLILIVMLAVLGLVEVADQGLEELVKEGSKDLLKKVTGLITALTGLFAALKGFLKSGEEKSAGAGIWVAAGSGLLLFGLLLLSYEYFKHLNVDWSSASNPVKSVPLILFACWLISSIVLGCLTNLNYLYVHRYYRDRLMEAYMPDLSKLFRGKWDDKWLGKEANNTSLSSLSEHKLPYHIINTNIVLVDSWIPKFKGRGGDNFILSPLYCGSNATGWRKTKSFMNNRMSLATAMAISGAALNPNTGVGGDGMTRNRLLSMVLNLLNLRLGYWAPNPRKAAYQKQYPNFLWPISFFFDHKADKSFIEISDGGHFENLALYELFRRRLKTILVIDAGMDSNYTFEDLGNVLEKVRADFGIAVDIKLDPLIPDKKKPGAASNASRIAESGFVVGTIHYPKIKTGPSGDSSIETEEFEGDLIYIKTTYVENFYNNRKLPKDVVTYKNLNSLFPDQPTSDQFFDEKQFEAYRILGHEIGEDMINRIAREPEWKNISDRFK